MVIYRKILRTFLMGDFKVFLSPRAIIHFSQTQLRIFRIGLHHTQVTYFYLY